MTAMFLLRARLRSDSTVPAIAPLLLPEDGHASLFAAHRIGQDQENAGLLLAPQEIAGVARC
jgi:hypothetical protein